MPRAKTDEYQDDFTDYLDLLGSVLTDPDQRASFAMYAIGLLSPLPRKSVEPIAALSCRRADQCSAAHQRLLHFLANSDWDNEAVRRVAAGYALSALTEQAPLEVSIVDDTGFIKQGKHSVGVQRQYTGTAGKVTNCQLAVSLTVATPVAQLPVDMQLYLPQSWMDDPGRRKEAKIPDDLPFRTKPQMAAEMLQSAEAAGVALGVVLADAAYGTCADFRAAIRALPRHYMVGVNSSMLVQVVDPKKGLRPALSLSALTDKLKPKQFRLYRWRDGSKGVMAGLFCILRVHVPDDQMDDTLWLLIEKTGEVQQPYKYSLSSLPAHTPRLRLVYLAKARWRTEQMYMECKEELGLDHYEGRGYPGWHHHVSAVLACYALVVARRERAFPPSRARSQKDDAHRGAEAATSAGVDGHDVRPLWQSVRGLAAPLSPLPPRGRPPHPHPSIRRPQKADAGVTQ
jgi:SRSO17 transposase